MNRNKKDLLVTIQLHNLEAKWTFNLSRCTTVNDSML